MLKAIFMGITLAPAILLLNFNIKEPQFLYNNSMLIYFLV